MEPARCCWWRCRKPQAPGALTQSAVLLDQLQDPGNLGSILRSAAAAGIRQIYCSPGTVFAWSPKVLRAGMGAHFLLEIFENQDLAALARATRIPVLATSSHARQTLYETDLKRPVAWLFGHEGQGVRPELLALASHSGDDTAIRRHRVVECRGGGGGLFFRTAPAVSSVNG